jgi:hypothetical protein
MKVSNNMQNMMIQGFQHTVEFHSSEMMNMDSNEEDSIRTNSELDSNEIDESD